MLCPKCMVEMRVDESGYVQNEGTVYLKQTFTCRNKNCKNYGKEVESIYMPLEITDDPDAHGEPEEVTES